MEKEEFVRKFANCFHRTPSSSITPETKFRELDEWGSMLALIVIAMLDADYGKTLEAEDLKNTETIAELYEIVKSK